MLNARLSTIVLFVAAEAVRQGIHLSIASLLRVSCEGNSFYQCISGIFIARSTILTNIFLAPKPEDQYPKDPCLPSPCGPNAMCKAIGETPVCTCMNNYIGVPPNCRPECSISSDCTADRSCIREKCRDPCPGSCGVNARCTVINHTPACTCPEGYTGDPFTSCSPSPPPSSKD